MNVNNIKEKFSANFLSFHHSHIRVLVLPPLRVHCPVCACYTFFHNIPIVGVCAFLFICFVFFFFYSQLPWSHILLAVRIVWHSCSCTPIRQTKRRERVAIIVDVVCIPDTLAVPNVSSMSKKKPALEYLTSRVSPTRVDRHIRAFSLSAPSINMTWHTYLSVLHIHIYIPKYIARQSDTHTGEVKHAVCWCADDDNVQHRATVNKTNRVLNFCPRT